MIQHTFTSFKNYKIPYRLFHR